MRQYWFLSALITCGYTPKATYTMLGHSSRGMIVDITTNSQSSYKKSPYNIVVDTNSLQSLVIHPWTFIFTSQEITLESSFDGDTDMSRISKRELIDTVLSRTASARSYTGGHTWCYTVRKRVASFHCSGFCQGNLDSEGVPLIQTSRKKSRPAMWFFYYIYGLIYNTAIVLFNETSGI